MKGFINWAAGGKRHPEQARRSRDDQRGKERLERREDGVLYPVPARETRAGPSRQGGDFNPFAYDQQAGQRQGDTGYPQQAGYYQDNNPYQRDVYPQAWTGGPDYNTMEQQFEAPAEAHDDAEAAPRTETSIKIENINARMAPLAQRVDALGGSPDTHYAEEYGKIMTWHPGYAENGTSEMDLAAQEQIRKMSLLHEKHKNDAFKFHAEFDSKWNNRGGEMNIYVDSAPDEVTRQERFLEIWEPLIVGLEAEHVGEWQKLATELAVQRYPIGELKKIEDWHPNYRDDTSEMGKLARKQVRRIERLRPRPDSDTAKWQALATRLEGERTKVYTDLTTRYDNLIGWLDHLQRTEVEKINAWQIRAVASPHDSADQRGRVGQFVDEYTVNIGAVRASFVTAYETTPNAALLNVWSESLDEQETSFRAGVRDFITARAAWRYEDPDFSAYETLLS